MQTHVTVVTVSEILHLHISLFGQVVPCTLHAYPVVNCPGHGMIEFTLIK